MASDTVEFFCAPIKKKHLSSYYYNNDNIIKRIPSSDIDAHSLRGKYIIDEVVKDSLRSIAKYILIGFRFHVLELT